jgi:hypothetical protein
VPCESKTKVDLIATEAQQSQAAMKIPATGGTHKTWRPQEAQTIRSFLIKKSTSFFSEHLQASFARVPDIEERARPALPCSRGD